MALLGEIDGVLLEIIVKGGVVEEDVGVLEFLIEAVLHLLHAADDTFYVSVSS